MLKTTLLFFATALCEIVGCYLPWLWLKRGATPLLLIPTALALALFVWLLTLHPAASGRVYAAYGGVYVCTALLWLRVVDGVKLTHYDWAGAAIALCGMLIIVAGWDGPKPVMCDPCRFFNPNSCMVVDLLPYLSDILFHMTL